MDDSSDQPPSSEGGPWGQVAQPGGGYPQSGAPYPPPYPPLYPPAPPGAGYPLPPGGNYPPPPGGGYPPPSVFPPPPGYEYGYAYGYPPPPPRQTTPPGFRNLFRKFWYVTTRPGTESVAVELPTANWRDVWLGILFLATLTAVIGFGILAVFSAIFSASFNASLSNGASYTNPQFATFAQTMFKVAPFLSLSALITVPLSFFITTGCLYLVAKLFRGQSTFLELAYAVMLYWVPIQLASVVCGFLPYIGGLISLGLLVYAIVLAVFAVAASMRFPTGRAAAVVLIPIAVYVLVICGITVALIADFVNAVQTLH